jgi:spoIIIJ-associated protein
MGIQAKVTHRYGADLVEADEAAPLVLDVTGGDLGILIGRQSETLQALQFMVRTMVSKETGEWQPIVVDVESYRARRRQSLRRLAEKMAERVVATHKKVVLEAMPAHERRIIHITLRDHPAVTTKSVGSDDNRKVTIIPK